MLRLIAILFVLTIVSDQAVADKLQKVDGRVLEGRVISETGGKVVFEISSGGITFRQRIPKSHVKSIHRESREGLGYCRIPISGEIGTAVKADTLKRALAEARRSGASVVILYIDSTGGSVAERDLILDVLAEARGLRVIAHVKEAMSAAAPIALFCQELFFMHDGTMGAAVPYKLAPDGTPENIQEKFRSAIRAKERAAALRGGRSDLWMRGMSEMDLELSVVLSERGWEITEGRVKGGKLIKEAGKILTVTGVDAYVWGLATSVASDAEDIRDQLEIEAWHNTGDAAWSVMVNTARAEREYAERQRERALKVQWRNEQIKRIEPQVADMDNRRAKASAEGQAAAEAVDRLRAQWQREASVIQADFDREAAQARRSQDPAYWFAVARERAEERFAEMRQRLEPQITAYEAAHAAAVKEVESLAMRRTMLVSTIPSVDD